MDETSNNEIEEVKDSNNGKKKSIKKNYIYNVTYQIFLLIVPLAVTPYIAKILLDDGVGIYSFTNSITTYFVLFAALSFGVYGQRLIARDKSNKKKQSIDFWEIVIAQFSSTFIVLIVYVITAALNLYGDKYTSYIWIMGLVVVSQMFDITFLFSGNEEFGKMVFRSILIKAIGIGCIFIFVNEYSDLWKYILIQCSITLFSNISLWAYLPKMITKVKLKELRPYKHLVPILVLFLPTIAISVYTNLDKTMIGLITQSDSENGNYEMAIKIVKLTMTVVTSLGTVFVPRNSRLLSEGKIDRVKENIFVSSRFVLFLGIPMVLGLIAIADNMVVWYLGESFNETALLIKVLSPIIIVIGLSNVFGLQYLIPAGKEIVYTIAVFLGAIADFVFNLILIRYYGALGAAISTILAELIGNIIMLIYIRKILNFRKLFFWSWKYYIAGFLMFAVCYYFSLNLDATVWHTFETIGIGIAIYFLTLLILWDYFIKIGFHEIKIILNNFKNNDKHLGR